MIFRAFINKCLKIENKFNYYSSQYEMWTSKRFEVLMIARLNYQFYTWRRINWNKTFIDLLSTDFFRDLLGKLEKQPWAGTGYEIISVWRNHENKRFPQSIFCCLIAKATQPFLFFPIHLFDLSKYHFELLN